MITTLLFDIYGTLAPADGVSKEERADYIRQITAKEYEQLILPFSFAKIKAFSDVKEGIELLHKKFKIATCSNWDINTTQNFLYINGIYVDKIIEVANVQSYKPKLAVYAHACDVMQVEPSEVLFVTGNKGGPDEFNPTRIGMKTIVIRNGWPNDLLELAGELGC